MFKEKNEFQEHLLSHVQERRSDMFNCNKCDKSYSDMRKLRRHDWRCHRSIECTICSETLDSRQEIAGHRLNKHKCSKSCLVSISLPVLMKTNVFMSIIMLWMKKNWILFVKKALTVQISLVNSVNRITEFQIKCYADFKRGAIELDVNSSILLLEKLF